MVHEKKRPYACRLCVLNFAEKSNLLKHCHAVHKVDGGGGGVMVQGQGLGLGQGQGQGQRQGQGKRGAQGQGLE